MTTSPAPEAPAVPATVFLLPGCGRDIAAGGLPVTVKAAPSATGGHAVLFEQYIPPKMLVPAHRHARWAQITIVTEGTLCALVGGDVYPLPVDSVLVRPAGAVHAIWNPTSRPACQMEVTAPGTEMLEFFTKMEELTQSGRLDAQSLADLAAPYGTEYDEAVTAAIEERYGVSARGGWRP